MRALLAAFLIACGPTSTQVRPDEMSARRHHEEARREREAAAVHLQAHDQSVSRNPGPPMLPGPDNPMYLDSIFWFTPTRDLQAAQEHQRHAQAHERAAAALEEFEARQCSGIAADDREVCERLGPLMSIRNVAGGVALTFVDPARAEVAAEHLRCHLAWARAEGRRDDTACPLDLDGLEIGISSAGVLLITSPHAKTVDELRRRARQQAMPGWR